MWTYFVEDSHSSLDTNTTEMSDTSLDSAPRVISASPNLDHTYYSIDAGHIYHTLDPATAACPHGLKPGGRTDGQTPVGRTEGQKPVGRVYINRNLDLVDNKGMVCLVPGSEGGQTMQTRAPSQLFQITPPPSFSLIQSKKMCKKGEAAEYKV